MQNNGHKKRFRSVSVCFSCDKSKSVVALGHDTANQTVGVYMYKTILAALAMFLFGALSTNALAHTDEELLLIVDMRNPKGTCNVQF